MLDDGLAGTRGEKPTRRTKGFFTLPSSLSARSHGDGAVSLSFPFSDGPATTGSIYSSRSTGGFTGRGLGDCFGVSSVYLRSLASKLSYEAARDTICYGS